jgi:acyl-CoA thioesterase-1
MLKLHFLRSFFVLLVTLWSCSLIDQDDLQASERKAFDTSDSTNTHAFTTELGVAVDTLRYLALGDSYTIGTGVSASERWPSQLTEHINSLQTSVHLNAPVYIAQNGWTTQALSNAMIASGVDTASYDVVSLLIGVNNQYQGIALQDYEAQFTDLLERAIEIANGNPNRVFVVSIPDYGYTPFGSANQAQISAELAQFNASCQTITASYGVAHYNITPISQQWPSIEGLIANDNLHPSGYQYGLWVNSFADALIFQLETN